MTQVLERLRELSVPTRVGLASLALIAVMLAGVVGVLDDDEGAGDGDPAAAARAAVEVTDLTAPAVAARFARAELVPTAPVEVRHAADGARIASQRFTAVIEGLRVGDGVLTCTARCAGGRCAGRGCEPAHGDCSPYACADGGAARCAARCAKAVTEVQD